MSFKNYSLRISVILLFSATLNTEANAAFFSTRGTYEFQDERVVRYEAQGNDVSPLQTFGIGANSTLIDRRVTPSVTASVYNWDRRLNYINETASVNASYQINISGAPDTVARLNFSGIFKISSEIDNPNAINEVGGRASISVSALSANTNGLRSFATFEPWINNLSQAVYEMDGSFSVVEKYINWTSTWAHEQAFIAFQANTDQQGYLEIGSIPYYYGNFNGYIDIPLDNTGTGAASTRMNAIASARNVLAEAYAYIDPYFELDAGYIRSHPGAKLEVESGFGNSYVTPINLAGAAPQIIHPFPRALNQIPEPGTLVLLGLGLAGLGTARIRRQFSSAQK